MSELLVTIDCFQVSSLILATKYSFPISSHSPSYILHITFLTALTQFLHSLQIIADYSIPLSHFLHTASYLSNVGFSCNCMCVICNGYFLECCNTVSCTYIIPYTFLVIFIAHCFLPGCQQQPSIINILPTTVIAAAEYFCVEQPCVCSGTWSCAYSARGRLS